jgi:hypothetical protein
MNIHFKNIPLKTIVYELPKDRSKPIPINKLKLLFEDRCAEFNKILRPLSMSMTHQKYPFKYEGIKREIEIFLLRNNGNRLIDYTINDDLTIDCIGNVSITDKECFDGEDLKYKFGRVDGKFGWNNDGSKMSWTKDKKSASFKNLPDWCRLLDASNCYQKDFTGFNTKIETNVMKIYGYGSKFESLKGLPDNIKFVVNGVSDFKFKIPENRIYKKTNRSEEWWAVDKQLLKK